MSDGNSSIDSSAKRLKHLRRCFNLKTQTELATKIGITTSEVNHFETGRRPINLNAANRIREHFSITLDWIYHGDRSGLTEVVADRLIPLSS